jgi:hypothetical protein
MNAGDTRSTIVKPQECCFVAVVWTSSGYLVDVSFTAVAYTMISCRGTILLFCLSIGCIRYAYRVTLLPLSIHRAPQTWSAKAS